MRASILALALVGLAPLALAACGEAAEEPAAPAAPAGPRMVLQASQAADWQAVSAEVATVDQAQVLARIPGILTSLTVREGDTVARGQVIGRIVDSQLGYQAGAYGAQAAAAEAQAAQARSELERVRFLHDNGVYADARLEQARAAASAANAQVRAARAQQDAVSAVAGQGALLAPTSGRVLRADVPAGAPVAPGMAIAVITAGPVILRLEMPESLADKVRAGSRVRATIGESEVSGTVTRLYPAVTAGQVTADVEVAGLDGRLIGRRVAALVETGNRPALLVPEAYVTTRYGADYVTVLGADGAASEVPVQTAPSGEAGKIEILSGVRAGDTLVGRQ
ncbi:efflux RND transporter periplasmic adaptor subunit [Alteraurantiacibacter buctensis]|uniref:Efflux RND transporter periplasmic adaptor subunit n=1 Tax=Alteraurantiacibacter buctensis TaxID=1503981 RepID=A0A844YV67_9SPHN|nr:efflux RND transporter periplasmic adaptor subunit [Alteraurantiacibacter buctensis]MXO70926.1 efflux RND transporter periplasmic adaptor subunit [Alteraurantiacibacter buctensis]